MSSRSFVAGARPLPLGARGLAAFLLVLAALGLLTAPGARAAEPAASPWWHQGPDGSPVVDLWVGWSSTCPHCQAARPHVRALDEELPWLEVHWLQVNGSDADAAIAKLVELAALTGEELSGVPAFLFAGRLEAGWADDGSSLAWLRAALGGYRETLLEDAPQPAPTPTAAPDTTVSLPGLGEVDAAAISLPVLAITLGGLDALNPCALSVLLFLMSVLAGTRDRRRMMLIGGTFVVVSGVVYFALMAAWLNAFQAFGALRLVTVFAGVAAVIAAFINLKDHIGIARGPSLVIPAGARPVIFGRLMDLSETTAMRALLPATILVAAVVNLYEMLCTGGFPVVFTRVLTLNDLPDLAYYGYLALYCVMYVLPAAAIVAIFTITLGSRGVTVSEARNLKLLSGLLMLGFGMMLLFAPDLLTDAAAAVGLLVGAVTLWLLILFVERLRRTPDPGRPAHDRRAT
jgi:hypothetical protein